MYHFAIVALLGLAAYKTVDLLLDMSGIRLGSALKTLVTLGVGVAFTEVLGYSVFGAWGIEVREAWMGPVFTGLIVGAMTYVWHEVFGYIEGRGGRGGRDGAAETSRTPRAA